MVYEKHGYYLNRKQTSGKTKNKMGGRHLHRHITDPMNTRMEEKGRRQRIKEESSERGQCPEEAVVPQME
jgi:hypothetical protein